MPTINLKAEHVRLINANKADILRIPTRPEHVSMGHLAMVDMIIDVLKADEGKSREMSLRALRLIKERV